MSINIRKSFAKIGASIPVPDLLYNQKESFARLLQANISPVKREVIGLEEIFRKSFPIIIRNHNSSFELSYVSYRLVPPVDSMEKCVEFNLTYSCQLFITVRLIFSKNGITEKAMEQEVEVGMLPLMTDLGGFIINGVEKVVISQIHRSPGVYFVKDNENLVYGRPQYFAAIIPYHGSWIDFGFDKKDRIYCQIDKGQKILVTTLLKAFGYNNNEILTSIYPSEEIVIENGIFYKVINPTLIIGQKISHDVMGSDGTLLIEKGRRIAKHTLKTLTANNIGKLCIDEEELIGKIIPDAILQDKVVIASSCSTIEKHVLAEIKKHSLSFKVLLIKDKELYETLRQDGITEDEDENVKKYREREPLSSLSSTTIKARIVICKILKDNTSLLPDVAVKYFEDMFSLEFYDLSKAGRLKINERFNQNTPVGQVTIKKEDILNTLSHLIKLRTSNGEGDDIDDMGNRRVRLLGELMGNQVSVGLHRLRKAVKERILLTQDRLTPKSLIPVGIVLKPLHDFFATSPLCQFADQENPLSGLSHKRRITAVGPGGISRDRAGLEVRDVHKTQYGRLCPTESPEGKNVGIVLYPATYSRINEYGFITTPYQKMSNGKATGDVVYLTAPEEATHVIAQASAVNSEGFILSEVLMARKYGEVQWVKREEITLMDVSPRQPISPAASLIPFFGHNDGHRILMGTNMQKQSVPLMVCEAPIVGTGIEKAIARDTGVAVFAKNDGLVEMVDAQTVVIKRPDNEKDIYRLKKFSRTNQGSCNNFKPTVKEGDAIEAGSLIADGPSVRYGELALGKNLVVAFMPWRGYNYEDSIVLSERLVKDDVLTSLHYEEYEIDVFETALGQEALTKDIPNRSVKELSILDSGGIVKIGTLVKSGDILVGKVSPLFEDELQPEELLLRALFKSSAKDVKDTSLIVDHGSKGTVVDVKIFEAEKGDLLPSGVLKRIKIIIADKKPISVGDKLAGRYGNKGIVSIIAPVEDMPFLPDGTPVDVVLNPCGVPSRMNIGQIMEVHLGMAMKALGNEIGYCLGKESGVCELKNKIRKAYDDPSINKLLDNMTDNDVLEMAKRVSKGIPIAVPAFDGATDKDIFEYLEKAWLPISGEFELRDGKTGECYINKVTVGVMYMLKLCHMVDHKIHARSVGTYAAVTQQPLQGRAKFGGQRIGEMEVWAIYAHGAAHVLQEMMTVKSDDITGRHASFKAIIKGKEWEVDNVPESFKVLMKELQSLCIDFKPI